MPRKRISIIWTTSKEKFAEICKSSKTMKEALSFFGLKNKGGNFRTFKKRVEEEGIDTSHFLARHPASMLSRRRAISEILVKNSNFSRHHLKKRLIRTLQLDHINGASTDNRLENLRLLCPNCHSQTETFAGRNKKNIS